MSPHLSPSHPQVPAAVARLLSLLPRMPHNAAMAICLSRVFAQALEAGELDFLRGKVVRLEVADAGIVVCFSLGARRRLFACHDWRRPDVAVTGTLYDYLLLASGREDPDTLFFQRRLTLRGDVELALQVKNFLHAREPSSAQRRALRAVERLTDLIERHHAAPVRRSA